MQRTRMSLDGTWSFTKDPEDELTPDRLDDRPSLAVETPAPWQSQAPELRNYTGTAWYRRDFDLPEDIPNYPGEWAVILGFGAVDDTAEVWVNGIRVGEHEGGYLPFEMDITAAAHTGRNLLVVRVLDGLENFHEIPHGKQDWYGYLSGIWQPAWVDVRPKTHLQRVKVTPLPSEERVLVETNLSRPLAEGETLHLEVLSPGGKRVAEVTTRDTHTELSVPDPLRWDLETPHLYTLVTRIEGPAPDEVRETFGFRTIEARAGRILLNGRPIFLRGALDQDYYPDLISTPPSQEYIEAEFRQAKEMGLNCLRIHIKVGDPRYYAAADKLGLLIWTELPNWMQLTREARRRGQETLAGMVARDWNHPSIVIWTIINESWGTDLTDPDQRAWLLEAYDFLKALDPERLIVGNSACWGNFQVGSDIEDFHNYYAIPDHYRKWRAWVQNFASRPSWTYAYEYQDYPDWKKFMKNPWRRNAHLPAPETRRRGDEPLVVSEFGNWGLPDVRKLYSHYGGEPWWFHTGQEFGEGVVYPHGVEDRFELFHLDRAFGSLAGLIEASQRLQHTALKFEIETMRAQKNLSGYVITEFTDAHWESNGLLDMVRNPKLAAERLAEVNADDVILPIWQRVSYWEGETCQVDVSLSHYSELDLDGARLEWQLDLRPDLCGEIPVVRMLPASVTRLGRVEFLVPGMPTHNRARLLFRLMTKDGRTAATNFLELFFYHRLDRAAPPARVYAPELAAPLSQLGYDLVDNLTLADLAIVKVLNDDLRRYLLTGGQVLWLAECDRALRTFLGGVKLKARKDTTWQGDWANSLGWICKDRMFSDLLVDGLMDFALADLTPNHVFTGLNPSNYAYRVQAGLAVGWLHRAAALVFEQPVGRGHLLASSFQLSRNLERHPAAVVMLADMVADLKRPT